RGMAEAGHGQRLALAKRAAGADGVQAAEQLAEAIQLVQIPGLRRATAPAREQGEAEAAVLEQALAVEAQGRDHRDLGLGQLESEGVLPADRRIAPALRPLELGEQRVAILAARLVDAVLVAVEGQHAGRGDSAHTLRR